MYSHKTRRNSRRRFGSRSGLRVSLIAAGGCVPVLIIGYAVTATQSGHAADAASVSAPGSGTGVGGWGRGGYTMMPGTTGSAGQVANAIAMNSANWAGYAATGNPGTFTSVSASWNQPFRVVL